MGNRLEGKSAVVTGGGRGIGRATALLLAEEGASIVVNDLGCDTNGSGSSHDPADSVVAEITAKGGKAVANYENVSIMEGGEKVIQSAVDNFGKIDILVNSVGILQDRMIHQMTPDAFYALIDNNAKGVFCPTKFAGILMRQQRAGRIVSMTSDAGLGDIGSSNFAAASEGVIGFTRTAARDLGRYGITANAISALARTRLFPGTVSEWRTAILGAYGSEDRAEIGIPSALEPWEGPGEVDDPENVAPLAVYLCTDAAPNANGYVFGVRGGDIFLYTNPQVDKAIYTAQPFTVDELNSLVPRALVL